ncbi:MAG: hypothetical protein ILO68_01330, partial [Clostridia bacterium]|nr:hypothetical protein [Clostridia bacterium]
MRTMRTILLKSSAAALLALACLLLFFLSACGVEGSESSAGSNDPESSGESIQGVSVQLRDATLSPTRLNAEPEGDEIALFERNYKKDGASVLDYTLSSNDRTVIGFSPEKTDGGNRFEVFAVLENEGEACPIPYGGFLLSVPKALLTDKRVRKGQVASVEGALSIPKGEPLQYGSFYPDGEYSSALERRIHLADPRVPLNESSTEPERIYYYSSDYDGDFGTLPEECTLAVLEKVTNLSSRIVRIVSSDHVEPGETALVFRGAYNRAYAETFLKEGMKVFLNHLDRVSSLCDREAVYVNSVLYPISDGHYNCASTDEDGVYLFDSSFSSPGVPTSKAGQRDIVLINEKVAFIGETNVPVMIPINGGVAVSLTGSYAESAGKLKIGDRAETVLIDTTQVSGKSVRIGETMFTYDKVDEIRAPEGVTVLYTPQYGNSTGSNMYGLEIAVSGGVVTGVENGKGNMTIPKDGYVISIHKDAAQFAAATQVTAGQTAMTFEDGIGYRLREAKVNRVNSTRSENTLIVYRNAKSTNTNAYGYEIAVD